MVNAKEGEICSTPASVCLPSIAHAKLIACERIIRSTGRVSEITITQTREISSTLKDHADLSENKSDGLLRN